MEVVEAPFNWAVANKVGAECNYLKKLIIIPKDSSDMTQPNFVTRILSESPDVLPEKDRQDLLWAAGCVISACTVSAISSFFLAMALYPEVQSRAQAEVDKVVTDGRLPQLSDRPNLPYVECVMQEVLRWNPVGPLGVPHMSTKDDVYRDYHLPAGTIIIANIWSILHDPIVFPDPHEFRPERFLNDKRADEINTSVFGFGRRACPGVYFAEASIFIAISMALSQCNISNPTNSRGQKIGKDVEYQTGTIRVLMLTIRQSSTGILLQHYPASRNLGRMIHIVAAVQLAHCFVVSICLQGGVCSELIHGFCQYTSLWLSTTTVQFWGGANRLAKDPVTRP
ncbi:cytochrome P450 [Mycena pura]|uniref:Cytochrome P450 n=1 Tax=Mycena pura TaxID=153505 RepID=A0AAD6V3M6_9AGAR|nr:cytochrome P450 [Mycena pura]